MQAPAELRFCNLLSVAVTVLPRRKLGGGSIKAMRMRRMRVASIRLRRNLANSAVNLNGGEQLQAYRKRQIHAATRRGNPARHRRRPL